MERSETDRNMPIPNTREDFLLRGIYGVSLERVPAEDQECPICTIRYDEAQENRPTGEGAVMIRRCGHTFGWLCLQRQVSGGTAPRHCPVCRDELYTDPAPSGRPFGSNPRPSSGIERLTTVQLRTRLRLSEPTDRSMREYRMENIRTQVDVPGSERLMYCFQGEDHGGRAADPDRRLGYMASDGSGIVRQRDVVLRFAPGSFTVPNAGAAASEGNHLIITPDEVIMAADQGHGIWDATLNLDFLMGPGPILCLWESEDRYISRYIAEHHPPFFSAIMAIETNNAISLMDSAFETRRVSQHSRWRMRGYELRNFFTGVVRQVEQQFEGLPEEVKLYLEAVVEIFVNWLVILSASRS